MKTILITGRIGAGKSEVARIIAAAGFPVYDSDSRTKVLYSTVPGLGQRIERETGVKMDELGRIFSDDSLREKLEAIVYPLVLEDFVAWKCSAVADASGGTVFFESALAHAKPCFAALFDSVLLVSAPYELRVQRNPKAAQRDALQSDPGHYDSCIDNSGTREELEKKVNEYLKTI